MTEKKVYKLLEMDENFQETSSQLDLKDLSNFLISKKKRLLINLLISALLGVVLALILPIKYQSVSVILPEMEMAEGTDLLSKYGSALGISALGSQNNSSELVPQLYPNIVYSFDFQNELINKPIYFKQSNSVVSSKDYFLTIHKYSVFEIIKNYTIGLWQDNKRGDKKEQY